MRTLHEMLHGQIKRELDRPVPDALQSLIVRLAGGKYIGTEEGFVWFNAPSGSTLVVPQDQLSLAVVRTRLAEDALKNYPQEARRLVA